MPKLNPIRIAITLVALLLVAIPVIWLSTGPSYRVPPHLLKKPATATTVLLIGNSHSTSSHFPQMIEYLGAHDERHPPLVTVQLSEGGAFLSEHTRRRKVWRALDSLDNPSQAVVVLQGHSLDPLANADDYRESAHYFAQRIRDAGARPILYPAWTRHENHSIYAEDYIPDDVVATFALMDRVTNEVAGATEMALAPTARAFELGRRQAIEIPLYMPDGNHASTYGAYLAALVVYARVVDDELPESPWQPEEFSAAEAETLLGIAGQALAH